MSRMIIAALVVVGLASAGCGTKASSEKAKETYPDLSTGKTGQEGTLSIEGVHPIAEQDGSDRKSGVSPLLFTVYDQNDQRVTTSRSTAIDLYPGRYLIRLNDETVWDNAFWVTVESGKTTTIDTSVLRTAEGSKAYVQ